MNEIDKKAFSDAAKDWATKSAGKDLGEYFWQAALAHRDAQPAQGQQEAVYSDWLIHAQKAGWLDDDFKAVDVSGANRSWSTWQAAAKRYATPPAAPDVPHLVDSVWAEYEDSVKNKWVFRREHVENAIRAALAKHGGA